ncbi:MAG: permease-like cell division protein FtsX [Deferribacterota bacterium]|nr:permease-like cell division protein FtsX [Deferribacterota bacterium]
MKKLIFLIKKGLFLFKRNVAINVVTITTITTILFIYNVLFILGYSSNNFLKRLSEVQTIRAFIKEGKEEEAKAIIKNLEKLDAVKNITYYSKDDTYRYMKKQFEGPANEIADMPKTLYPSFLEISLKDKYTDIDYVKEFQNILNKYDVFKATSYGEKWVLNFLTIKFGIHLFIFILSVLISISIASIIYNTIKINLAKRKMEVMVYNLVGATRSFIVVPYIVCTLLEIFIGFVVSYSSAYLIFYILDVEVLRSIGINILSFPPLSVVLCLLFVVLFIAIFSSSYSLGVFLDNVEEYNE